MLKVSLAIAAIGQIAGDNPLPDRPGISVKLSALHPRYEAISFTRVMAEMVPDVIRLARAAKRLAEKQVLHQPHLRKAPETLEERTTQEQTLVTVREPGQPGRPAGPVGPVGPVSSGPAPAGRGPRR